MVDDRTDIGFDLPDEATPGLGDASADAFERAVERVREAAGEATEMISAQPVTAIAFATLAGLALGLILGGGRREVIYLRQ